MKRADSLRSEEARAERKATRAYLRRRINVHRIPGGYAEGFLDALKETLDWVLARQKRYDARPGGGVTGGRERY